MRILQRRPKTANLVVSLLLCLTLMGCNSAPKKSLEMQIVVLENGLQVTNCNDYQQMRSVFTIRETLSNQIASAEYLTCTLAMDLKVDDNAELTMRRIFHGLAVRALPISLSARVQKDVTLSSSGFQLWLEKSMLTFDDDQTAIQIQYKGKLKNGNHLVWVSDNVKKGDYAAYFPAIIIMQDGQVLGAAAVYASGF